MQSIIQADNINFSYNKQAPVLTDVSFDVFDKDYVGIIGPNGGGKSTLIKIILGLLTPDRGTITVFGTDCVTARDKIGYVPQYSRIDLDYPISAWDVVLSGFLGNQRIGTSLSAQEKEKAQKVLEDLKLTHLKDHAIGELSGGQRQRIMIARALVRDPELLLLDEPTNNVDESSGRDLYELLHVLNERMAIVTVSHDIEMISRHVKRICCLNTKMVCHDAATITDGDASENITQILHSETCVIH
jgi:zinc transport system ATP-binding protein